MTPYNQGNLIILHKLIHHSLIILPQTSRWGAFERVFNELKDVFLQNRSPQIQY
jgi:hypothetical protein